MAVARGGATTGEEVTRAIAHTYGLDPAKAGQMASYGLKVAAGRGFVKLTGRAGKYPTFRLLAKGKASNAGDLDAIASKNRTENIVKLANARRKPGSKPRAAKGETMGGRPSPARDKALAILAAKGPQTAVELADAIGLPKGLPRRRFRKVMERAVKYRRVVRDGETYSLAKAEAA